MLQEYNEIDKVKTNGAYNNNSSLLLH